MPQQHSQVSTPPPPPLRTTVISSVHTDILESHILTRLDGPTLASASCVNSTLHSLTSSHTLWSNICHSTWPSTASLRQLISSFPHGGPRNFFSLSYPLPAASPSISKSTSPSTTELISAVDIHYDNHLIFSKVQHTETRTGWFRCSPLRIDLLDPKDVVPTKIHHHPDHDDEDTCTAILNSMSLSWILIDPLGLHAMNVSSFKPVSVQRHWLSREVQVRFATVLAGSEKGGPVQCEIVVQCGVVGEMQVREVSLEMEDMEGVHLNGRDSLVILERGWRGSRGKGIERVEEGRRRYREYTEKKRESRERKKRLEGVVDVLCVVFGVIFFAVFGLYCVFCKWSKQQYLTV